MKGNTAENCGMLNVHAWMEITFYGPPSFPSSCLSAGTEAAEIQSEDIRKDFPSCFPTMSMKAR